ncbi:nuclear transport factor 2 family protein [Antrihabitans cavernicola]|uniref:Nuclear transport factor 2 family protein n=1 Tax=Antrihabitans cavernicola TaxID=2495913 RepID=A0A5A7SE75_9NOCA|nr:nuclear transport factor 2 family protein [Spelaeibacter cavernicola]KAA0022997.1 nuclear transport factor 2 family protein [Spelaeibacter cavernicola]
MTLSTEDRLAIHELVALHGHLVDDHQPERLDELFTADAVLDIEQFGYGTIRGLARLREVFAGREGHPIGHHTTNTIVTVSADGTVRARSKGFGVNADGTAGTTVYDDVVTATPNGWRIAHRTVVKRE